jgi:hypothetical protein
VPLSNLQIDILRTLAAHRDPESDVAGSTFLVRRGARIFDDIGTFHDREERVVQAAEQDVQTLKAAGLEVAWQRREPSFYRAIVSRSDRATKLERVVDSDFRYVPTVEGPDPGSLTLRHPRNILAPATVSEERLHAGSCRPT